MGRKWPKMGFGPTGEKGTKWPKNGGMAMFYLFLGQFSPISRPFFPVVSVGPQSIFDHFLKNAHVGPPAKTPASK